MVGDGDQIHSHRSKATKIKQVSGLDHFLEIMFGFCQNLFVSRFVIYHQSLSLCPPSLTAVAQGQWYNLSGKSVLLLGLNYKNDLRLNLD